MTAPALAPCEFAQAFAAWEAARLAYTTANADAKAKLAEYLADNPTPRLAVWINREACDLARKAQRHAKRNGEPVPTMPPPILSTAPADLARTEYPSVDGVDASVICGHPTGFLLDGKVMRGGHALRTGPDALPAFAVLTAHARAYNAFEAGTDKATASAYHAELVTAVAVLDTPAPDLAAFHAKVRLREVQMALGDYDGSERHAVGLLADMDRLLPALHSPAMADAVAQVRRENGAGEAST